MTWQYKADKLEIVRKLGFNTIEEALICLYKKTRSQRETAKILGITQPAVSAALRRLGVKANGRGGANNTMKTHRQLGIGQRAILASMVAGVWYRPIQFTQSSNPAKMLGSLARRGLVEKRPAPDNPKFAEYKLASDNQDHLLK